VTELISVIVATYNRPDALDAVLRGLACQSDRGFEIVVADDGSGPETAQVVQRWAGQGVVPVHHVWHEDRGFRAAEIRNRAVLRASGHICIFLDGDCIPRPHFIAAHRALAEPGWFVTGNRVLLSEEATERVLANALRPELWPLRDWLALRRAGGVNRLAPLVTVPLGPLRKLQGQRWHGARSCNMAVAMSDLMRVDGFDATFSGWGLEDSDLAIRLMRHGVRRKDGRFATGVLHLWHPENDRSQLPDNERRLEAVMRVARIRAQRGLSVIAAAIETEQKEETPPAPPPPDVWRRHG